MWDFPHRNRVVLQLRSAALTREFTREAEIAYPEGRHRVKIGDLTSGMFVRIFCEGVGCKHMVEIDAEEIQAYGDPDTDISQLAPRFKCRQCRRVGTRHWDAWIRRA